MLSFINKFNASMVLVRQRLREVCYDAMNMPWLGLCSLGSHGKAFPLQVMNT